MLHKISTLLSIAAIYALLASCGKSESDPIPAPGTFLPSLPANNSPCLQGNLANNNTSEVEFKWQMASNADSYELEVKDLTSQKTTTYTSKETSYKVALETNKPYSWCVKASNVTGNTSTDKWYFYLTGKILGSYAPFPAELQTPAVGSTISAGGASSIEVSFKWKGNDLDNDIAGYSLYLDNKDGSTQVIKSLTEITARQTLTSGKTYYWKVVTTDKVGNTSVSAVGSFRII